MSVSIRDVNAELASRVQAGDQEARNEMVTRNLRLVYSVAHKIKRRTQVPLEDLIQEGSIGLIRAVEGYDPSMGTQFATFATTWVSKRISRSLHAGSRVVRMPIEKSRESIESGVSATISSEGIEDIPDRERLSVGDCLAYHEQVTSVVSALERINPSYADVIRYFYGIGCDKLSLKETAIKLGISRETARKYRDAGLEALTLEVDH